MTTADGKVVGTAEVVGAGDPATRRNLVVLGDGYREGELARYRADVKSLVDKLLTTATFSSRPQFTCRMRVLGKPCRPNRAMENRLLGGSAAAGERLFPVDPEGEGKGPDRVGQRSFRHGRPVERTLSPTG